MPITPRSLAPLPPAASAAYSTVIALQAAGMPERPAYALGAVVMLASLIILTALINAITPARA